MTDREIILFLTNLLSETSTLSTHNKFKFQHTIRKYEFEKIDGTVSVTERFNNSKVLRFNTNVMADTIEELLGYPETLTLEWFEEFKLVVKHDIKTEIHNLLFDKLT
jgi:hypothetical protein